MGIGQRRESMRQQKNKKNNKPQYNIIILAGSTWSFFLHKFTKKFLLHFLISPGFVETGLRCDAGSSRLARLLLLEPTQGHWWIKCTFI